MKRRIRITLSLTLLTIGTGVLLWPLPCAGCP